MLDRLSASLVLPAALCGAVAFYFAYPAQSSPPPRAPESGAANAPGHAALPSTESSTALPPDHPPIGGMSPHGSHGGMGAMTASHDDQEPAAITWTAPSSWRSLPNPTAMRLATYDVGNGAELSVTRARGTVDANIERWSSQFEGSPRAERSERQVRGLEVTVVHITGNFLGGGMSATTPEKRDAWAMLAAIVDSTGSPYFFKLVGPVDTVKRARAGFDTLVGSVTPHDDK